MDEHASAILTTPVVDVVFRLKGRSAPVDHAYVLYSAISRRVPALHEHPQVAIAPLRGHLIGDRRMALDDSARLVLRLPADLIPATLPLAGSVLNLAGDTLVIGVPEVHALQARPRLESRIVIIKGFTEPAAFLQAAQRQLQAQEIEARLHIPETITSVSVEGRRQQPPTPIRRTLRIRDKSIVGFPLVAEDLDPDASVRLQAAGLGGRRRFGCGFFA